MLRSEILDEAKRIVTTDRNKESGEPEDNFGLIASLWNLYLGDDGFLSGSDVAALMILLKLSRIFKTASKVDSWIDIAGYAACGGEIATKEKDVIV